MPGVTKKPVLCLSAVTDEEGHPLENEDDQVEGFVCIGEPFFQRHHQHEEILRYVQQAPDDIRWTIDRTEFDKLIVRKKDSAPGPDGIPYGAYKCAGNLGSQFLFDAYRALLERDVPFQIILLRVELFLSPRPLTLMTMEGSFDQQTHFVL